MVFISGIIDNPERHQDRKKDIHESVDPFTDVKTEEFLDKEGNEGCHRQPQGPGLETILRVIQDDSPLSLNDWHGHDFRMHLYDGAISTKGTV